MPLVTFLILFTTLGFAEKYALYIGGGDPIGMNSTWFDQDFKLFTQMKNRGWSVDYVYGDERKDTRAMVESLVGPQVPHFTAETFQKQIDELGERIASGKIKKDDQLLIDINTH